MSSAPTLGGEKKQESRRRGGGDTDEYLFCGKGHTHTVTHMGNVESKVWILVLTLPHGSGSAGQVKGPL